MGKRYYVKNIRKHIIPIVSSDSTIESAVLDNLKNKKEINISWYIYKNFSLNNKQIGMIEYYNKRTFLNNINNRI